MKNYQYYVITGMLSMILSSLCKNETIAIVQGFGGICLIVVGIYDQVEEKITQSKTKNENI